MRTEEEIGNEIERRMESAQTHLDKYFLYRFKRDKVAGMKELEGIDALRWVLNEEE